MKKKWIREDKLTFTESITGLSKIVCYSNGRKWSQKIVNVQDDSVPYDTQRLTDCGFKVKVWHQVIVNN